MNWDKKASFVRFIVNLLLVFGSFLLLTGIGMSNNILPVITGAVVALNIFKEIHDRHMGNGLDFMDILSDVLGISVGTLLAYLIGTIV